MLSLIIFISAFSYYRFMLQNLSKFVKHCSFQYQQHRIDLFACFSGFQFIKKKKANTLQIFFYCKFGQLILQNQGTSGHHSHNAVIINDTLGVHPSKHKGQIYCL